MHIDGTIIRLLDEVTGQGQKGPWRKREFVLQTQDQYPKQVCVTAWGDLIDQIPAEGDMIRAHIDVASREYNNRWYTDVKVWKFEPADAASDSAAPRYAPPAASAPAAAPAKKKLDLDAPVDDDLPF